MRSSFLALAAAVLGLLGCGSTVATIGAGGAGGHSATGSAAASGTGVGPASSSAGSGGVACSTGCMAGTTCCNDACVNPLNDIHNCGACGNACGGDEPFCNQGTCGFAPCNMQKACNVGEFCCNFECCMPGMLCCEVQKAGPSMGAACVAPENGTCPVGCPTCK